MNDRPLLFLPLHVRHQRWPERIFALFCLYLQSEALEWLND